MTVAVIDYGAGNLRSVARALIAAGASRVEITRNPDVVAKAHHIVLPGVGAFAQCITALEELDCMIDTLTYSIEANYTPFLGICVGMQLLATEGHEHGVHKGLEFIAGKVTRLTPDDPTLKIPHMGWNRVTAAPGHDFPEGDAYFVHSYRFDPDSSGLVVATSDHGGAFPAVVQSANITGVQFHPEKSQAYGLAFLKRWLGQ